MESSTVLGAWLEPATDFKRTQTKSEESGRRVLGEKGIGRFAVSRLADELELITRRPGDTSETRAIFSGTHSMTLMPIWTRFRSLSKVGTPSTLLLEA